MMTQSRQLLDRGLVKSRRGADSQSAAPKLISALREARGQDGRDESRPGRQECLRHATTRACVVLACLIAAALSAADEPLVGKWLLKSQQVSGQETTSRPLTLEIRPTGGALEFEYSVPSNSSKSISLHFVAHPDGSASDVKNAQGQKIGTAKLLRGSALEYSLTLEGPNRPTASGKMKLSADRATLVCESDSAAPGGAKIHTVQVFARQ